MEEDGEELSPELIQEWRQRVRSMREEIFGSIPLRGDRLVLGEREMTHKEMTGYLDDLFEHWRGVKKQESGDEQVT